MITITVTDRVNVTSPFNSDFVTQAKKLNGKWSDKQWHFHVNDLDRVKEICRDIYGTDGDSIADLCTVRVEIGNVKEPKGPVTFHGRTIARAFGRDSGAKLGDGIVLVSGEIKSGGSAINWITEVYNLVVLIHDFPRATAIELGLKIDEESGKIDLNALIAERERLMARIADIDKILSQKA